MSTRGCRLKSTDRHVIGAVNSIAMSNGYVDLSRIPGRAKKVKRVATIPARKPRHRARRQIIGNGIA